MSSKTDKKKAVVPKLRFPEFRDAGPWEVKRLGEVAQFLKGKNISKADIAEDGATPCVRYGELYTRYGEKIDNTISSTNLDPDDLVISKANDVIIPASGETEEDIATASCILNDGIAVGGDINIIRSCVNGVFLSYYLNSAMRMQIARLAQGVSVIHLYPNQLQKLKTVIPAASEQQKIADCLSSLDEVIELQTQKLEALKVHKKGLMQQLFPREGETTPRLRFPEFRDAGPWEVKRLGEVGEIITGTTPSTKRVEYYSSGVYPWVTPTDIDEEKDITETKTKLSEKGLAVGKFVPRSSLLVTCIASIGKNAILRVDGSCNQQINAITSLKSTSVDFLYYLIGGKVHVLLNAAGQGGMAILNKNEFSNLRFPFPPFPEQQKIADCLSSLDEVIELQTKKLEALKAHKKGLMQQLFPQEVG